MIRKMNKNEREEEGDKTKRIERDARARSIFVIHNSWGIFLYFHFSLSLSLSLPVNSALPALSCSFNFHTMLVTV